ncbi:MAG: hypothetical protein EOQ27_21150 [Mesorhizobium sp.]|nr:MAG: hypothetical protein EOQ27_21150 [Mesorhizobium sp.]
MFRYRMNSEVGDPSRPPLSCRTSPPRGGRLAVRASRKEHPALDSKRSTSSQASTNPRPIWTYTKSLNPARQPA